MIRRMSIGELASATGAKVNTIRFYEDSQVMPVPERTASGRRRYGGDDLRRLRFIRRARGLGFSLDEIRSMLALSDNPEGDCGEVNLIASGHLKTVEAKIEQLTSLRDELSRITRICEGGSVSRCRVLEVLENEAVD